jgi:hypothetical protein
MTIFAMGFLFIMIFTVLVGVGAMFFLSFDSEGSKNSTSKKNATTRLFEAVRRINTSTIETVDKSGNVQEWKKSEK